MVRNNVWGGGERYAYDLCRRSAANGDEVAVVTRGQEEIDKHFRELPVALVKAPLGGLFDVTTPLRLARLIKSYPEEEVVVHVHTFKDAELVARAKKIVGKRKRIRLICTRHLVKRGKGSLRWRGIYRAIDKLIFVSEKAKREFLDSRPPIDEGKIRVVHNSIVVPDASVASERPGDGAFLYIGRISPEKGIDTLIRALAQISDANVRLRIVGTGDAAYIDELKALASSLKVAEKIQWAGFVADVFGEIRRAECCILPSRAMESFGLTIIEAMSQGCPVITTDNGAQPEIITDGVDGFLVAPDDVAALASALKKIADNPELRRQMGQKALATFRSRFSYDVFFAKIQAIYTEPL